MAATPANRPDSPIRLNRCGPRPLRAGTASRSVHLTVAVPLILSCTFLETVVRGFRTRSLAAGADVALGCPWSRATSRQFRVGTVQGRYLTASRAHPPVPSVVIDRPWHRASRGHVTKTRRARMTDTAAHGGVCFKFHWDVTYAGNVSGSCATSC